MHNSDKERYQYNSDSSIRINLLLEVFNEIRSIAPITLKIASFRWFQLPKNKLKSDVTARGGQ